MPCVSDAAQKPPLRPDAPNASRSPSSSDDALALLGGLERGPQPGEPAADDDQVGLDGAVERRARRGSVRVVEPERPRGGSVDPAHVRLATLCARPREDGERRRSRHR